jgi:arabinose-5-phosphate isomerase
MDLEYARQVLDAEARAVAALGGNLGESFDKAARAVFECRGHVVATGMGKAGLIAQKVSATFASTGTPSIFLHPAEAYHGDLGRIRPEDIVLAFSNSGETEEIVKVLPRIREIGARVISITSTADSVLAKGSDIALLIGKIQEPCPLKLAPSASTTAMLALGDALALTVLKARGWNEEKYAFLHPGGALGLRLKKVSDLMRTGERHPVVPEQALVKEAVMKITACRAGAVTVVDGDGRLSGIFTDGDLRRALSRDAGILERALRDVMTRRPLTISPEQPALEAAALLTSKRIDEIPVVNGSGEPVGMLDIQDLLALGMVP